MGHSTEEWGLDSVDPSHTSSNASSFRRMVQRVHSNAKCRFCLWVAAAWCIATIIFMVLGLDQLVDKVAMDRMVLQENGGDKYDAWRQAPTPVYYRVTVFNLTNPTSFMAGARPVLSECGPYVYRMIEEKLDVEFHDNATVSYRTKPVYLFEESQSNGREDDVVNTVNIPLVNAADAVKNNQFLETIIKLAQEIYGFRTLRKLTVKELLWGYNSDVMNWARSMRDVPYPHPQFGLLVGFNNTPQEPYTMYTGGSDPLFMNTIYAWNGKTELDFWFGDQCNEIKGTDASGFHPNVKPTDRLYIFNGQLCRSMPLVYQKTVYHSGVKTYRFVYPKETFSYGSKYPQNDCFCTPEGCPFQGMLDMKPCYWGAAIAFSFPHFYNADPTLRHVVRGLRPKKELHETYFDIYPKLGVPLQVKLRMQMNVVLDGKQALQRARHFDVVFPVFWFEAGIDSLPNDMVGMLRMAQDLPSVVKTTIVVVCASVTFLFLALLLASAMAGYCGVPTLSRSMTPENLPDQHWNSKQTQYLNYNGASAYKNTSFTSLTPIEPTVDKTETESEYPKHRWETPELPDFQNLPSLDYNFQEGKYSSMTYDPPKSPSLKEINVVDLEIGKTTPPEKDVTDNASPVQNDNASLQISTEAHNPGFSGEAEVEVHNTECVIPSDNLPSDIVCTENEIIVDDQLIIPPPTESEL